MIIAGRTFSGTDVRINISSCPIRITKDIVVLMHEPGSELIRHNSIHRVEEIEGRRIAEYAYAFDKNYKFCGFVVYKEKFCIWNKDDNEFFDITPEMTFVGNSNRKVLQELESISDPIKFSYQGEEYLFKHIIGSTHEGILIYSHDRPKLLSIKDESEVTVI